MTDRIHIFIIIPFLCLCILSCASPQEHKTVAYKTTLAVLHFENKTGDEDLDYLGRCLYEWISSDLMQSKYLNVLPEGSQYPAERRQGSAGSMGAQHILRGSFKKDGGQFCITARIHDPSSEVNIGTIEVTSAALEEIPSLVDDLTTEIKAALNLTPDQMKNNLDEAAGRITTPSPEAMRHYTAGRSYFSEGQVSAAISSFQKAVIIDPEFALAHGKLGMAFPQQTLSAYSEKADALLRALEHPDRLSERAFLGSRVTTMP